MAGLKLQIRQFPADVEHDDHHHHDLSGADADVIKGFITTPIEQAVASAEGIDTLVSTSQQNVVDRSPSTCGSTPIPTGRWPTRSSKVNQVRGVLPRDANDPIVVKQTGQGFALMYLSFNSNVMTASQITDYLTRVVQPRLQTVDGVANAQILGGQTFAMRIWLDPTRMAALGVTPNDVSDALAANNFTTAAGEVKSDYTQISVNALTSLDSAKAFGQLVVAAHGDALVRLGDVAKIELGPQSSDSFVGVRRAEGGVHRRLRHAGSQSADRDRRRPRGDARASRRQLPAGLNATIAYDSTEFIRASIREVAKTLVEAAAIVIVVIFLFLGNLRSTIIPIVTIPLSLIGVMIALLALGYSINLLTLLALVLGIGLVVDDAIVVVENIHRHIEDGMTPFDAAIQGAHEIALPVVAMTITLAAVYAPIGFVSGVTGALFREFAFTLAGRGRRLRLHRADPVADDVLEAAAPRDRAERRSARFVDRDFRPSAPRLSAPARTARLNFRALTLLILVGVLGADRGHVRFDAARARARGGSGHPAGARSRRRSSPISTIIEQATQTLYDEARTVPEVAHAFIINGFPSVRSGFAGLLLKPWDQRTRSQKQVLAALGPKFLAVPDGAGAGLLAAGAARLDRRRADAVRHPHHRRLSRRSPTSR